MQNKTKKKKKKKKRLSDTFFDPCHNSWSGDCTPLNFRIYFFYRSNHNEKIMEEKKIQRDTTHLTRAVSIPFFGYFLHTFYNLFLLIMQNKNKKEQQKKRALSDIFDPCHNSWSGDSTPLNFRIFFFYRSNHNEKIIEEKKIQRDTTHIRAVSIQFFGYFPHTEIFLQKFL